MHHGSSLVRQDSDIGQPKSLIYLCRPRIYNFERGKLENYRRCGVEDTQVPKASRYLLEPLESDDVFARLQSWTGWVCISHSFDAPACLVVVNVVKKHTHKKDHRNHEAIEPFSLDLVVATLTE